VVASDDPEKAYLEAYAVARQVRTQLTVWSVS
jgi:hypothetical protein